MKDAQQLISAHNVKISDIVNNYQQHYLLEFPGQRNFKTAQDYNNKHFDEYRSIIANAFAELANEATFELQKDDFIKIQEQTALGIGDLFLKVMNASR